MNTYIGLYSLDYILSFSLVFSLCLSCSLSFSIYEAYTLLVFINVVHIYVLQSNITNIQKLNVESVKYTYFYLCNMPKGTNPLSPDWKNSLTGSICCSLQELHKFECRNERFSIPKWNPKGIPNHEKRSQKEPKRQKESSMTPFRNRVEQVSKKDAERGSAALALGSHLKTQIQNKLPKTHPRKHAKINHGKT